MRRGDFFVSVLLLFVAYFYTADALNCFQCDSRDNGCDELTVENKTSPYYKPCHNITYFCRKTSQTVQRLNVFRTIRECGWITDYPNTQKCINYNTQHKQDTTCQCFEDGCNAASIFQKSSFIWVLPLFIITIIEGKLC